MGTRAQEVSKMATALEEQDKAIIELKSSTSNTNSRIDQLTEMISGLALQQSRLMQHLQIGESKSVSHQTSGSDVGHYSATARIGKLEFPRFSGEGVREWLYRCEQFFEVDMTPDDVKVKLVAIHLEGRALQWYQAYVRSLGVEGKAVIWSEYVTAVVSRFGDSGYEDPMADLKNLRQ
ncbi:hypothetical protein CRG98_049918, partial [Punica granatum]